MAITENIKDGVYRVWNAATSAWDRYALWTKANRVEFDDGDTIEDRLGDIKGITTSMNVTEAGFAADASAVKEGFNELFNKVNLYNAQIRLRNAVAGGSVESSLMQGFLNNNNPALEYLHYDANNSTFQDQLRIYFDGTNFYAVGKKDGADTVTKKLGEPEIKTETYTLTSASGGGVRTMTQDVSSLGTITGYGIESVNVNYICYDNSTDTIAASCRLSNGVITVNVQKSGGDNNKLTGTTTVKLKVWYY